MISLENLIPYIKDELKKGTRLNQIMRHTLGLFHGQTGSSYWKRYLSENMCVRDADVKKIDHIMDKVKLAPQSHTVGLSLIHIPSPRDVEESRMPSSA